MLKYTSGSREKWRISNYDLFAQEFLKRRVLWDQSRRYPKAQKDAALISLTAALVEAPSPRSMIVFCNKFKRYYEKKVRAHVILCLRTKMPPELALRRGGVPAWMRRTEEALHVLPKIIQQMHLSGELPPDTNMQVVWREFVTRLAAHCHTAQAQADEWHVNIVANQMRLADHVTVWRLWQRQAKVSMYKYLCLVRDGDVIKVPRAAMTSLDWQPVELALYYCGDVSVLPESCFEKHFLLKRLVTMYQLVKTYKVEEHGGSAAKKWAKVVRGYSRVDETSPSGVLLQRRWFELKRVSRTNIRTRMKRRDHKVHPLMVEVVSTYPHVLKEEGSWAELVRNGMVYDVREVQLDYSSDEEEDYNINNTDENAVGLTIYSENEVGKHEDGDETDETQSVSSTIASTSNETLQTGMNVDHNYVKLDENDVNINIIPTADAELNTDNEITKLDQSCSNEVKNDAIKTYSKANLKSNTANRNDIVDNSFYQNIEVELNKFELTLDGHLEYLESYYYKDNETSNKTKKKKGTVTVNVYSNAESDKAESETSNKRCEKLKKSTVTSSLVSDPNITPTTELSDNSEAVVVEISADSINNEAKDQVPNLSEVIRPDLRNQVDQASNKSKQTVLVDKQAEKQTLMSECKEAIPTNSITNQENELVSDISKQADINAEVKCLTVYACKSDDGTYLGQLITAAPLKNYNAELSLKNPNEVLNINTNQSVADDEPSVSNTTESDLDLLHKIDPAQTQTLIMFSDSESEIDNEPDNVEKVTNDNYLNLDNVKNYLNNHSLDDILTKMDDIVVKSEYRTKTKNIVNEACIVLSDSDEEMPKATINNNARPLVTYSRGNRHKTDDNKLKVPKPTEHVATIAMTHESIKDEKIYEEDNESNKNTGITEIEQKMSERIDNIHKSAEITSNDTGEAAKHQVETLEKPELIEFKLKNILAKDSLLKMLLATTPARPWMRENLSDRGKLELASRLSKAKTVKKTNISCVNTVDEEVSVSSTDTEVEEQVSIDPKLIMDTRVYLPKLDKISNYNRNRRIDYSINLKRISKIGHIILNFKRKSDEPTPNNVHHDKTNETLEASKGKNGRNKRKLSAKNTYKSSSRNNAAKKLKLISATSNDSTNVGDSANTSKPTVNNSESTKQGISEDTKSTELSAKDYKTELLSLTDKIKLERDLQKAIEHKSSDTENVSSRSTNVMQRITFESDDIYSSTNTRNYLEDEIIEKENVKTECPSEIATQTTSDDENAEQTINTSENGFTTIKVRENSEGEDMELDSKDLFLSQVDQELKEAHNDKEINILNKATEERSNKNRTNDEVLTKEENISINTVKTERVDVDNTEINPKITDANQQIDTENTNSDAVNSISLKTEPDKENDTETNLVIPETVATKSTQDIETEESNTDEVNKPGNDHYSSEDSERPVNNIALWLEKVKEELTDPTPRKVELPDRTSLKRHRTPTAHVAPITVRKTDEGDTVDPEINSLLRELSKETASAWHLLEEVSLITTKRQRIPAAPDAAKRVKIRPDKRRKTGHDNTTPALDPDDLARQNEEWERQKNINKRYFTFHTSNASTSTEYIDRNLKKVEEKQGIEAKKLVGGNTVESSTKKNNKNLKKVEEKQAIHARKLVIDESATSTENNNKNLKKVVEKALPAKNLVVDDAVESLTENINRNLKKVKRKQPIHARKLVVNDAVNAAKRNETNQAVDSIIGDKNRVADDRNAKGTNVGEVITIVDDRTASDIEVITIDDDDDEETPKASERKVGTSKSTLMLIKLILENAESVDDSKEVVPFFTKVETKEYVTNLQPIATKVDKYKFNANLQKKKSTINKPTIITKSKQDLLKVSRDSGKEIELDDTKDSVPGTSKELDNIVVAKHIKKPENSNGISGTDNILNSKVISKTDEIGQSNNSNTGDDANVDSLNDKDTAVNNPKVPTTHGLKIMEISPINLRNFPKVVENRNSSVESNIDSICENNTNVPVINNVTTVPPSIDVDDSDSNENLCEIVKEDMSDNDGENTTNNDKANGVKAQGMKMMEISPLHLRNLPKVVEKCNDTVESNIESRFENDSDVPVISNVTTVPPSIDIDDKDSNDAEDTTKNDKANTGKPISLQVNSVTSAPCVISHKKVEDLAITDKPLNSDDEFSDSDNELHIDEDQVNDEDIEEKRGISLKIDSVTSAQCNIYRNEETNINDSINSDVSDNLIIDETATEEEQTNDSMSNATNSDENLENETVKDKNITEPTLSESNKFAQIKNVILVPSPKIGRFRNENTIDRENVTNTPQRNDSLLETDQDNINTKSSNDEELQTTEIEKPDPTNEITTDNSSQSKEDIEKPKTFLKLVPIQQLTDPKPDRDGSSDPKPRGEPIPFQCDVEPDTDTSGDDTNEEDDTSGNLPVIKNVMSLSNDGNQLTVVSPDGPSSAPRPVLYKINIPNMWDGTVPDTNVTASNRLNRWELSSLPPTPVSELVKARDCTKLALLCVDEARPLWKPFRVNKEFLLLTCLKISTAEPSYWTVEGRGQCAPVVLDKAAEGSTIVGALSVPDELYLDNHWYRKLSSDPLIYAKIWYVVQNKETCEKIANLGTNMKLFAIDSGAILSLQVVHEKQITAHRRDPVRPLPAATSVTNTTEVINLDSDSE